MPFLQPDHRPSIRHPQGHPVEVITSHKSNGELKPLYFRLEDDRQERFTFMLSQAFMRKEFNYIMIYECTYDAYGRKNSEYSCAAEPPFRCGVSHLSGTS